jgi:alpha-beta hydrolase superfamily lysophospholipase
MMTTINDRWPVRFRAAGWLMLMVCLGMLGSGTAFGQESREVSFPGHQLKLAGTLLVPKRPAGGPKQAAAVIIGEWGTTTRDGMVVGDVTHPIYREMATSLATQGVVTLRFDRRCRGASECRPVEAYDDYIDDLHGAIKFLAAQPEVDPARLVLIGHGEGAYMATSLLAQQDHVAAGLIVAAMSGRTLGKMMREEFQARMMEEGRSPAEINEIATKVERITRALFYSRSEILNEKFDPRNPYHLELEALLKEPSRTVSLLVNDPLQAFAAARVPVLILQGDKDLQVTRKDSGFLEEALKRIYHPDFTLRTFPDMDHLLLVNQGKPTFASYRQGGRPVDPQFLTTINSWISTRFGAAGGEKRPKAAR